MPEEDKRTVYQRVAAVKSQLRAIPKGQVNLSQKFRYRGIDDMYNNIGPIEGKEGVFWTFMMGEVKTEKRKSHQGNDMLHHVIPIDYFVHGADGDQLPAIRVYGEAMDTGDKGINKCLAIAHKYAMIQLYSVPTLDLVDPDSESPEIGKGEAPKGKPAPTPPVQQPAQDRKYTSEQRLEMSGLADKLGLKGQDISKRVKELVGKPINQLTEADAVNVIIGFRADLKIKEQGNQ
jgi:hypothetical protein